MLNFDRKKAFKAEQTKKKHFQSNSLVFLHRLNASVGAREILEQREEKIY
jgi:hypothetical protein